MAARRAGHDLTPRSRRGSIFLLCTTFFLDYDVGRFNMRLGLINSAWVQANQPTTFGLRKTKELGFDCIDIFADPLTLDVPVAFTFRR